MTILTSGDIYVQMRLAVFAATVAIQAPLTAAVALQRLRLRYSVSAGASQTLPIC